MMEQYAIEADAFLMEEAEYADDLLYFESLNV